MVLEVRLKDGRIVRSVYVDSRGRIEGIIVGGQDGVDPDLGFSETEIDAVRQQGFVASFMRLGKWITADP